MKTKVRKLEKSIKISESNLLSLVASKLENRVLFPEMVKKAREYLKGAKFAKS